jgi:hypothetical protein
MGALTEVEIFDCLSSNFKLAAELAEDLAKLPLKGIAYDKFRKTLRLIEGACKQASTWREDTRWLKFGLMMAECHKRAGNWLRGAKLEDGTKVKMAEGQTCEFFLKMADGLRGLAMIAERTKNERTGKVGMILPVPLPAPHRDTRPVGFRAPALRMTNGGIILPDGVGLH